jgi:hypothetical protein
VAGLIVIGDAEPLRRPRTFPQKIKNRVGSKAFPLPIKGPHLSVALI